MAKIVYGVAGEGFGHSSRSELIGQYLINAGHDVLFAASRKAYHYLKPTFNRRVKEVYGLSFCYRNGHVHPARTVLQNISGYRRGIRINRTLFSNIIRKFEPDVVISDFEPFSAWWAWRNRVPCVSIDHEHLLSCCLFDTKGTSWKERALARIVMVGYHTCADAYMVLNFFKAPLTNQAAQLVPPVVRENVLQFRSRTDEHILVYSTDSGDKMRKRMLDVLSQCGNHRFYIYGFDAYTEAGNCVFKKTSTDGFLNDLASCRAVVATAGFSLLSECLYFRKPMMLMPVGDQYEQVINAHYVEKLGMGVRTETLGIQKLKDFLRRADTFRFDHPLVILPDNAENFRLLNHKFQTLGLDLRLGAGSAMTWPPRQSPMHLFEKPLRKRRLYNYLPQ